MLGKNYFVYALLFCCFAWVSPICAAPQLDESFGLAGRVAIELGAQNNANAILLQPDDKIVVAGSTSSGEARNFSLLRFNQDGSLDQSFNGEGTVVTSISLGNDEALALGLLPDGRIIAAGYSDNGRNRDFALVCYFPDGHLDKSFGVNGVAKTPVGSGNDEITSLLITREGSIVVAGSVEGNSGAVLAGARYFADGELDASFGEQGVSLIGVGRDSRAEGLVEEADGSIVLSGTYLDQHGSSLMLVRMSKDGIFDASFGQGGVAVPGGHLHYSEGYRVTVDEKGRFYVAGAVGEPGHRDTALFRFLPDGIPDPDFGTEGVVINRVSDEDDVLYDVLVNERGVVGTGFASEAGVRKFLLASYATENESPDAPGLQPPLVQLEGSGKYPVLSNQSKKKPMSASPVPAQPFFRSSEWRMKPLSEPPPRLTLSRKLERPHRLTEVASSLAKALAEFILPSAYAEEAKPVSKSPPPKVSILSFGDKESVGYAALADQAGNVLAVGVAGDAKGSSMTLMRYKADSIYQTNSFVNQKGYESVAVLTLQPNAITRNTALTGGEILPDFGQVALQKGVVFSLLPHPVLAKDGSGGIVEDGSKTVQSGTDPAMHAGTLAETGIETKTIAQTGLFRVRLGTLQPGMSYYVRAYAIGADHEVYYGKELQFTTADACFVATAAYGSLLHPFVRVLRDFRDRFLMSHAVGRQFIAVYYQFSPDLATFIAAHHVLRLVVALFLLPLVGLAWLALQLGLLPGLGVALLLLFAGRHFVRNLQKRLPARII